MSSSHENLQDADYIAQHTLGFEELRAKGAEYPPERVADWTGITADDIRTLAREYATTRPAGIRVNYGIQRCENGGMAVRAIMHAALHYWLVERGWWRTATLHQRRIPIESVTLLNAKT